MRWNRKSQATLKIHVLDWPTHHVFRSLLLLNNMKIQGDVKKCLSCNIKRRRKKFEVMHFFPLLWFEDEKKRLPNLQMCLFWTSNTDIVNNLVFKLSSNQRYCCVCFFKYIIASWAGVDVQNCLLSGGSFSLIKPHSKHLKT